MKKEATRLVKWLRKSKSKFIHTLLWLPSFFMPVVWCFYKREDPNSKRYVQRNKCVSPLKKTLYVIRLNHPAWGLAPLEANVACCCAWAEKQGYLPVVDLQNLPTMYHENDEVGKVNIWERYYEQPAGISLEEIPSYPKVIYGDYSAPRTELFRFWYIGNPMNAHQYPALHQRYIRINEKMRGLVDDTASELGFSNGKILGVIARGTDYIPLRPAMHAIPPCIEKMILHAKDAMASQNCTKLFLATEDLDILEAFKEAFDDRLIYTNQQRFRKQDHLAIANYASDRANDRYLRGEEYLIVLELLTRCDCLIGVGCNAFYRAAARKNHWDYIEQFDEGRY